MNEVKRRFGDRRDATLIRKQDSMHLIMPMVYPNRCDNEAFISERIDLTNIDKYLEKRNAENPEFKFTLFHLVVAAILKTIILRPKLNRFIANKNNYQRNTYSASFVIKKQFSDSSEEGMAFVYATEDSTLDSLHEELYRQIYREKNSSLGSIKLRSGYHHLTNWGTTSIFVVVGEMKERIFRNENGEEEYRNSVDLGLTIDERIADGFYYSKSVKILKYILEHPECLERPFSEPVDI